MVVHNIEVTQENTKKAEGQMNEANVFAKKFSRKGFILIFE